MDAMDKLPRHFFFDPIFVEHAYEDKAFPIGEGQTISQPYTVAFQTELLEIKNGSNLITTKINLSKDRGFAKSNPDYWVKIWKGNKWSKKTLTGLFKTRKQNVYFGYEGKKEHLILFKFSNNGSTLTLYYFENFFTNDLTKVLDLIK